MKSITLLAFVFSASVLGAETVVYVVTVEPIDTHVTLTRDGQPIAEADSVDHVARFEVEVGGEIHVIAPGFRERPEIQDFGSGAIKLRLSETSEAHAARTANEDKRRREDYVAAHAQLSREVREAILAGELREGMALPEVEAAIGVVKRLNRSGGAGGVFEIWTHRTEAETTSVVFHDSLVVRWSVMAN